MTSHSYEVALFGEFFPKDLPGTQHFIAAGSLPLPSQRCSHDP